MKNSRWIRAVAVSLAILLVVGLGSMVIPNQSVTAAGGRCSCGGRVFDDPTNNPYVCGQCTWYASFMRQDIPDKEHWGDAGVWDDVARVHTDPEFSVGEIPYPRSIVVYEGWLPDIDDPGHVAYVESVNGDSFNVSEMNWEGQCFNENRWDIKREGVSFIYPPSDTPVQLWPYPGHRVEYGDSIILRWYGDAEYYDIQFDVLEGGSNRK